MVKQKMNEVFYADIETNDRVKRVTVISRDGLKETRRQIKQTFGDRLRAFDSAPKNSRPADAGLHAG